MNKPLRTPWLQFRLRSLLGLMLVVAAFLAGRMSAQRELVQLRRVVEQSRRAQQQALLAEEQARYLAELSRAQAMLGNANLRSQVELLEQAEAP